jgi:hypothetical protein
VETVVGKAKGNEKVAGKLGSQQVISSPWNIVLYQTKYMNMELPQ